MNLDRYPYSPDALKRFDAFELFPLDGGAFFFLNEHLGSATGAACLAAMEDGSLLAPWMGGDRNDWDRAWHQPGPGPLGCRIEQHVWLNRLYFLLPIALQGFRTCDARWAEMWHRYFSDWSAAHPAPTAPGQPATASQYVWFDMQIAWRLLVLVHSTRLIGAGRHMAAAVRVHADLLCHEADHEPAGKAVGNHHLHKAVALLYAGALTPEWVDADRCIGLATTAIERHRLRDLFADGGDVEASPSYSHFMARLYADAEKLLGKASPGTERMYDFLANIAGPDGRSLQVNDAYALDVQTDREAAGYGTTLPRSSQWFRDSRFATIRAGRFDVYVDALPQSLYHHHAGKPNLLVFADGHPVLADAGCCNYDRHAWTAWFRTTAAHNTISIDDTPPADVTIVDAGRFSVVTEATWPHATWRRTVTLRGDAMEIIDDINAEKPALISQNFLLATGDTVLSGDGFAADVFSPAGRIALRQADASPRAFTLQMRPGVDRSNRPATFAQLQRQHLARRAQFVTQLELPRPAKRPEPPAAPKRRPAATRPRARSAAR